MADPAHKFHTSLYEQDFFAWSEEQGRLLKARNVAALDWDNLAEEIETLGRSERSEIRSRLVIVLLHLLKWEFQPAKRKAGWAASLLEARTRLVQALDESPSLRSYPETVLDKEYRIARLKAAAETRLPAEAFPLLCPYSVSEILDDSFLPGPLTDNAPLTKE